MKSILHKYFENFCTRLYFNYYFVSFKELVLRREERYFSIPDSEPRIFKYNETKTPTLFTVFSLVEVTFETNISKRLKVVKGNR